MKIKGLSTAQLNECAKTVGVDLGDVCSRGTYVQFKVKLIGETYRKYRHKRKVWAVCWHGFRDFIREVYKINSTATIITSLARYEDEQHFEVIYPDTGYVDIGSRCMPLLCKDACHCN